MRFVYVGAPAHFTRTENKFLNSYWPNRRRKKAKRNGLVASAITQPHSCQLQPVRPSEGRSLLEKGKHPGRAVLLEAVAKIATTASKLPASRAQSCIRTNGEHFQNTSLNILSTSRRCCEDI